MYGLVGSVRFGLVGNGNLAITSCYCYFQTDKKPATYFSGQVGRTTATVIIELPQSSLAGARLSLANLIDGKSHHKTFQYFLTLRGSVEAG